VRGYGTVKGFRTGRERWEEIRRGATGRRETKRANCCLDGRGRARCGGGRELGGFSMDGWLCSNEGL
jgi:hypothetical protein